VELGVHLGGGSVMFSEAIKDGGRELHLFDTWEEQPAPSSKDGPDVMWFYTNCVAPLLDSSPKRDLMDAARTLLIEEVGMPSDRVVFHRGLIEETLPLYQGGEVALCHLDLDYYEATSYALEWLEQNLARGGVVIMNDWRHFRGVREAVHEFSARSHRQLELHERDGHAVIDVS
jgi:O-methyltransferase